MRTDPWYIYSRVNTFDIINHVYTAKHAVFGSQPHMSMHSKKYTDVLRKQKYATVKFGELAMRPQDDRDTLEVESI